MIEIHEDEKIILEKRKHWFVIVTETVFLFFTALLPLIILLIIPFTWLELDFINKYKIPIIFFSALWIEFILIIFFTAWTNYYLDILLVTNKRVIDIEQHGLFNRDLAELRLENIQDIKVEILGILPSLLKFGNIYIQTAGKTPEIVIKSIHDPHRIRDVISQAVDERTKNLRKS